MLYGEGTVRRSAKFACRPIFRLRRPEGDDESRLLAVTSHTAGWQLRNSAFVWAFVIGRHVRRHNNRAHVIPYQPVCPISGQQQERAPVAITHCPICPRRALCLNESRATTVEKRSDRQEQPRTHLQHVARRNAQWGLIDATRAPERAQWREPTDLQRPAKHAGDLPTRIQRVMDTNITAGESWPKPLVA